MLCSFVPSRIAFASLLISLTVSISEALAAPTNDSYTATATELVETFENAALTFDGIAEIPPVNADPLTQFNERYMSYTGIPGGVPIFKPGVGNTTLLPWAQSGHVLEFKIKSTDGEFVSLSPAGLWGIAFDDIDLDRTGAVGTPQVIGMYFAFRSDGYDVPYSLNSPVLNSLPLGLGNHPLDGAPRKVIYLTRTDAQFDALGVYGLLGNKLNVFVDSEAHFQSQSLQNIVFALGLTTNVNNPPLLNEFLIGVLVTGLTPPVLVGDYNCNGVVDAADYTVWRKFLGATVGTAPCSGDGDGNGVVTQNDYDVWRANFGNTQGSGSGSASEQSAAQVEVAPTATPSVIEKQSEKRRHWGRRLLRRWH